jgi:hypothetical protein
MKIEHLMGLVLIAISLLDLILSWKMANGVYPWDSGVSQ